MRQNSFTRTFCSVEKQQQQKKKLVGHARASVDFERLDLKGYHQGLANDWMLWHSHL